jgi:hypothetical protein
MQKTIGVVGMSAGVLAVAICLISGVVRLSGSYGLMDIPAGLAFQSGVGLMVFACMAKLYCAEPKY